MAFPASQQDGNSHSTYRAGNAPLLHYWTIVIDYQYVIDNFRLLLVAMEWLVLEPLSLSFPYFAQATYTQSHKKGEPKIQISLSP